MKKINMFLILLFLLTFSSNADLMTVTASAEAENNTIGQFIEYTFSFDTDRSGYYSLDGGQPIIFEDMVGFDLFFAYFDGSFYLPVSDAFPQMSMFCGLTDYSSSVSIIQARVNGNVLSVSGGIISDWQVGDILDGLERGSYADGSEISIGSQLTITNIAFGSLMVPEPSTLYMFFAGLVLLFCILIAKRKNLLI